MERIATTSTATGRHRDMCDVYCKNDPPDASQNRDPLPQLTENGQLKTPRKIKRHTGQTCVNPGDAYCKNHPPDASPDFNLPPQPTQTEGVTTP
ncbi:hypothetical protein SBA4_4680003 [Candidatus Sulfopaludibacter sp. SbA4]|nr:hypothetical protein SBA4_4680003 [Candidatus Sulfopaludibacter sp. SbA4]